MKMLTRIILLTLGAWQISVAQTSKEERPDFAEFFTKYHVSGSFLLYDLKQDKYIAFDSGRCRRRFLPASTFKIFNSLVALETGVAPDEHMVLKWDSVQRSHPEWNKDQDMTTAMKNSTVWYYQEIARRIGEKRMLEWITREHYGNMDISGGIDQFWLRGGLRISQEEQIDVLRRLYSGELHFSRRTMEIVKRIIILKDTVTYTLRGKTGWGDVEGGAVGWLVGYLEQNGDVYFYATNIEAHDPPPDSFAAARRGITEEILKRLGLL